MPNFSFFSSFDKADVVLMSAGGIILLIAAGRHLRSARRDPLRGAPLRPNVLSLTWVWLAMMGYLSAALVAGLVVAGLHRDPFAPEAASAWRQILVGNLMQVFVIGVMLWIARQTFAAGRRSLGLGRRPLSRDLVEAVYGWLVAVCLCTLIAWGTEWLIYYFAPDSELPIHTVFVALQQSSTPMIVRVVAVVGALVLAPVGEELFFRGIIQTCIHKAVPARFGSLRHRWVAIAATALLFGAMHYGTPQHIPALTCFGVVVGYLYERTGSLTLPILVHMLFNAKTMLWYYLQTA